MVFLIDLPPELLHEIFLNFYNCKDYPHNRTLSKSPLREYEYVRRIFTSTTTKYPDYNNLTNVRLTCRSLNFAASEILYRHYYVLVSGWDYADFDGAVKLIANIIRGRSAINSTAKKLLLNLSDPEFFSHSVGYRASFRDNLVNNIPSLLRELPRLETLRIDLARSDCVYGQSVKFDLARAADYTSNLADGIFYSNLQNLTSLYLTLLCTKDFETFARRLPAALSLQLQHLYLAVADGTGPGGTDVFNRYMQDVEWLPSNLQQISPNVDHQQGLFDLVLKCDNLKSLAICATQHLNLDLLNWYNLPKSLQVVYFNRLEASSEELRKLLWPPPEQARGRSGIERVQLTDVELTKGTWDEVFQHLLHSPSLSYFCAHDLGYTATGESAGCRVAAKTSWNPLKSAKNIWTKRSSDQESLKRLFGVLNQKAWDLSRQGGQTYPHDPACLSHTRPDVYA